MIMTNYISYYGFSVYYVRIVKGFLIAVNLEYVVPLS